MEQILPPNTPTYEMVTHNWTCPDNTWLSFHALNLLISCNTNPDIRPIHTDHLPIVTTIDLLVPRSAPRSVPDFHNIDFNKFNKALEDELQLRSPPAN